MALTVKHPLYADRTLHRELAKTGLPFATVTQIRTLRECGWGLKPLADFFGLPSTVVALATSHVRLKALGTDLGHRERYTRSAVPKRAPRHPAEGIHFGRSYSDPTEGIV